MIVKDKFKDKNPYTYLEQGWSLAHKILKMSKEESIKCFGYPSELVPTYFSYQNAFDTYIQYLATKSMFKVGDEIENTYSGEKFVILSIVMDGCNNSVLILYDPETGCTLSIQTYIDGNCKFKRTGKHYEKLAEAMKEIDEDKQSR